MTTVYDAFISYSHRDMRWARWLQKRLETYRPPRDMQQENAFKPLRVFRDQTDLAGVELFSSLQKELAASRYLIVICSPNSAASRWVGEEVRAFLAMGREDRVIPFIVSGEPDSDDPTLECFSPALRGLEDRQQLGANIREIGKEKALLRVLAVLLDVRLDRLAEREKRRKKQRIAWTASAALAAAAVLTGLLLRNAAVSRKNQQLSYDIYWAALAASPQKDQLTPDTMALLTASAKAGNPNAMLYLADCCQNGWGVEKDEQAAFQWYQLSAMSGDASGMTALANCYLNGIGVAVDEKMAYAWYLKAAEAGSPYGMYAAGSCCQMGAGVMQDEKAAFQWYQKAADAGMDAAMYSLALCYRDGIGTSPDLVMSFQWIKQLAESGNVYGMYNLGLMYQFGLGTPENPQEAYRWYRQAALAGDPDGMYRTAWCIENHYGIDDPALAWYQAAALAGSPEAEEALERLRENNAVSP